MELTLDTNDAKFQIQSFIPGTIRINHQLYTKSVILTSTILIDNWTPQSIAALQTEHFSELLALKPEIIIIGTGEQQHFPPIALYGELLSQGIGIEFMHTAAACRTFNALTAEGRNVIAALILR